MGVMDAPQWLPAAFVRSVLAVGATAGREEIEATCRRLIERWQEPDRHFHNLKHLVDVLARVDELAEETHHPDTVRLAAWYHGAVFNSAPSKAYSRSGGEDEAASAELAREELGALGVPAPTLDRIAELVLNLKRHEIKSRDIDCLALSDADLAVLASDPQHYQAYRKAVRAEYEHLPKRHYVEGRRAIVSKLLGRRHLFVSPMGSQWEDAARENLTAELALLDAELAKMGEAGPEESVLAAEAAQGVVEEGPHHTEDTGSHVFVPAPVRAATEVPAASALPSGPGEAGPTDRPGQPDTVTASSSVREPAARGTASTPSPDEAANGRQVAGPGAGPADAATAPSPAEARADAPRPASRPSSLESLPDELLGRARPSGDVPRAAREAVARSSRELIEQAVRERRERADRDRSQRERLEAVRAEREQSFAPLRERRTSRASTLTPPSPATSPTPGTPATPRTPGTPDSAGRHVPVEQRHAVEEVPQLIEGEPVSGDVRPAGGAPQHGIEREPDLFDRPRRKKDRKRDR
jgi:predicted metal-dependent HD superfamily phosphohydrolase